MSHASAKSQEKSKEKKNGASQQQVQPSVLEELGLVSTNRVQNNRDSATSINAVDILKRLLETISITPDQIRTAHTFLCQKVGLGSSAGNKNVTKSNHGNQKESNISTHEQQPQPQQQYRRRHIALRIYYEGKDYAGLAQNVGLESDNSVERQLFTALVKTRLIESRETSGYSRCGRTDKGVSAVGQVVAMQLKSAIPLDASWDEQGTQPVDNEPQQQPQQQQDKVLSLPKNSHDTIRVWVPPKTNKKAKKTKMAPTRSHDTPSSTLFDDKTATNTPPPPRQCKDITEYPYDKMLNNVLPDTIRVLGWCPVSPGFSARFSASTRTYRYFFVKRPTMDATKMRQALALLVGEHDFRNFCKLNVVEVSNFVRKIHAAELIENNNNNNNSDEENTVCYFQIQGQAFLWHQIRCIVSVLFLVGRGLESPSVITELLNVEKYPGKPSYPLAAEFPLVLHDCGYPNLQMGYSVRNLWAVTCQLEEQWETSILEAARIQNCLEMLRHDVRTLRQIDLVDFCKRRLLERQKKQRRSKQDDGGQQPWTVLLQQLELEQEEKGQQEDGKNGHNDNSNGNSDSDNHFMTWDQAITWMKHWKMVPDSNSLRDHVHIPLLDRSKGTTYEEKIESLQQSATKRSQRYEENAAKKRKAEGGDADFYEHMLQQGGSAV